MNEILNILLKITIVIFMADNLLDLGLRVNLKEALRGLRDVRFVTLSVVWAFVLSPANGLRADPGRPADAALRDQAGGRA